MLLGVVFRVRPGCDWCDWQVRVVPWLWWCVACAVMARDDWWRSLLRAFRVRRGLKSWNKAHRGLRCVFLCADYFCNEQAAALTSLWKPEVSEYVCTWGELAVKSCGLWFRWGLGFLLFFCVLPCKIKYYKMTTVGNRVVRAFCKWLLTFICNNTASHFPSCPAPLL